MATTNDITGDSISTKGANSPEFKDGWDRIFGKKKKEPVLVWSLQQDPDNWDEARQDIIGQNGNDGLHYEEIPDDPA